MTDFQSAITLTEWEAQVGNAVRQLRIARGYDQIELADRANVSRSAVQSLERGTGSRLRTLLAVLRALDRLDALDSILPDTEPSPLQVLAEVRRSAGPQRSRKSAG
jgi:transcriptional regulator with XRE-family HTH domain